MCDVRMDALVVCAAPKCRKMDKGLNLTLNLKRELEIDLRLRIIKLADILAEAPFETANANSPSTRASSKQLPDRQLPHEELL